MSQCLKFFQVKLHKKYLLHREKNKGDVHIVTYRTSFRTNEKNSAFANQILNNLIVLTEKAIFQSEGASESICELIQRRNSSKNLVAKPGTFLQKMQSRCFPRANSTLILAGIKPRIPIVSANSRIRNITQNSFNWGSTQ